MTTTANKKSSRTTGARSQRTLKAVLVAAFAAGGCVGNPSANTQNVAQEIRINDPAQALQTYFNSACSAVGRQALNLPGTCTVSTVARTDLSGGIAEYSVTLQLGIGAHDIVGLHRVVKESSPYVPMSVADSVMMVHGDLFAFEDAFLDSPANQVAPIYLAQNNVDVWGIDLRWAKVPDGTSNFDFMKDWGMSQDMQDLGMALSVARANRYYTGSSFNQMLLLGWSRGGQLGYLYLADETQQQPAQRHVNGFIPVDIYLKLSTVPPNAFLHDYACHRYLNRQNQWNAGLYVDPAPPNTSFFGLGQYVNDVGLNQPQTALPFGGMTYFPDPYPPTPWFHLTGANFGANNQPTSLKYTQATRWNNVLAAASPFEATKVILDAEAVMCDQSNLDAHLADISVPIFYVGAKGGFGSEGAYTLSLITNSVNKTSLVKSDGGNIEADYGHSDIWLSGSTAKTQWWQPILNWTANHFAPQCQQDSDCILLRDNNTCQCLNAAVGGTDPPSSTQCVVDPCARVQVACVAGACTKS